MATEIILDDLWVGDLLKIKATGAIGKFAGAQEGQALLDLGSEKILVDVEDLILTDEPSVVEEYKTKIPKEIHVTNKGINLEDAARFRPVIDLHMKALNPINIKLDDDKILDYQLDACHDFLDRAGAFNIDEVKIIHGKGKGTLKNQVASLLKFHHFVHAFESTTEGGSFRVYLK